MKGIMNKTFLAVLAGASLAIFSLAQEGKNSAAAASSKEKPAQRTLSMEELEAKFKAMLTNATLSGRWAALKDGALGEEKEDKYQIVGAGKISGDSWVVH